MINEWCLNPLENIFKKSDVGQSFINLVYLLSYMLFVDKILMGQVCIAKVKITYLGGGTKNETILNPYNTTRDAVPCSAF